MKKQLFAWLIRMAKLILFYEPRHRARARHTYQRIEAQKQQGSTEALVSILLPVYNVAQQLPHCLDSLLVQTYSNLEIICVNDASTDRSLSILTAYAARDSRVKIIDKPHNAGLPQARATALLAVSPRSAYVISVDSDDWIAPELVSDCYYLALADKADIVVCDYFKDGPHHSDIVHNPPILENALDTDSKLTRIAQRSFAYGNTIWNRLIKTPIMQQIDFPTANAGEDIAINAQLYFYADKIVHYERPLYHWQQRERSMTNAISAQSYSELRDNYTAIYDFCKAKFGTEKAENALADSYQARLTRINQEGWS